MWVHPAFHESWRDADASADGAPQLRRAANPRVRERRRAAQVERARTAARGRYGARAARSFSPGFSIYCTRKLKISPARRKERPRTGQISEEISGNLFCPDPSDFRKNFRKLGPGPRSTTGRPHWDSSCTCAFWRGPPHTRRATVSSHSADALTSFLLRPELPTSCASCASCCRIASISSLIVANSACPAS